MLRKRTLFCLMSSVFLWHFLHGKRENSNVKVESNIRFKTEDITRGALKAKRGMEPHALFLVKNNDWGVYFETRAFLPVQYKRKFGDRWSFNVGYLKKVTAFFTWDMGAQYNLLQCGPTNQLSYWRELYTGIRTDLLLSPSFYIYHDFERRQWCVEIQFAYDFELTDSGKWTLDTSFTWGYLKAKKPFGGIRSGYWNRKNHYWYTELEALLAYHISDDICIKMGPHFAYNRDGTGPYSIANERTHHSHLCSLIIELSYRY